LKFDQSLDAETLPTKIYKILRDAIMKGQLQPGDRLVQNDIAQSLGVSRMPVREAVKQLASEGYVLFEPHKGAIVKKFSVMELEEIYLLRAKLEPLAVIESLNNTDHLQLIHKLEQLNNEMKKCEEIDEYVQLNIEFHHLLIKDCPLEKLNSIIENLWNGFPQQTPHLLEKQVSTSIEEHEQIINALKSKNIERTSQLVEAHITRAGKDVIQNIAQN
jgi:DNA-binding GntR family transcriptional regulator